MQKEGMPIDHEVKNKRLQVMFSQFRSGNEDAATDIFNALYGEVLGFFAHRLPEDAEDLLQETFEQLFRYIPRAKEDKLTRNPRALVYVIARNRMNSLLQKRMQFKVDSFSDVKRGDGSLSEWINNKGLEDKEAIVPERNIDQMEEPVEDMNKLFRQRIAELLSSDQYDVVCLLLDKKSPVEIAEALHIPKSAVANRLTRARKIIEKELIFPAGFHRVGVHGEPASKAASEGMLRAANFLGLHYTTNDWAADYERRRVVLLQSLLDEEFLPIAEHVTPEEYRFLRMRKNNHLIRREQGRLYIKRDDLDHLRVEQRKRPDYIISPVADMQQLKHLAGTAREYRKLLDAAKGGKLTAVLEGKYWYAKPEDAQAFLTDHPDTQLRKSEQRLKLYRQEKVVFRARTISDAGEGLT